MANITIEKVMENQIYLFKVRVEDEGQATEHSVTLNKADYQRLTNGDIQPEVLIKKSFEFLLENEPKEKILPQFDFTVINRYFPNFRHEIEKRIQE